MRPGDIIRRTTKSGFPIGAYYIVSKVNDKGVFGRYLYNINNRNFLIIPKDSKNIQIIDVVNLCLCKETMERVLKGKTLIIEHSLSSQWNKLVSSYSAHSLFTPQNLIVLLYDPSGRKAYYTIERKRGVVKMCNRRVTPIETYIRLTLENQISSNVIIYNDGTIQRIDI